MREHVGEYLNGTAAIQMPERTGHQCRIIAPDFRRRDERDARCGSLRAGLAKRIRSLLDSSEMTCSLRREDHRGCAYGIFSDREAFVFSAIVVVLAALAIAAAA